METADVAKKFITNLALTIKAKEDLNWWYALDGKVQMQCPLQSRLPTMTIESDAFNMGWRTQQCKLQTGRRWSLTKSSHHINYLKLLAAFLALQCFAKHSSRIAVQMRLDNVKAVTYINKFGVTHSQALCQLALMIWDCCIQRDVFLVAEHLPGKDNIRNSRL